MTNGEQTQIKSPAETQTRDSWKGVKSGNRNTHTRSQQEHTQGTQQTTSLIQYLRFIAFLAAGLEERAVKRRRGNGSYQICHLPKRTCGDQSCTDMLKCKFLHQTEEQKPMTDRDWQQVTKPLEHLCKGFFFFSQAKRIYSLPFLLFLYYKTCIFLCWVQTVLLLSMLKAYQKSLFVLGFSCITKFQGENVNYFMQSSKDRQRTHRHSYYYSGFHIHIIMIQPVSRFPEWNPLTLEPHYYNIGTFLTSKQTPIIKFLYKLAFVKRDNIFLKLTFKPLILLVQTKITALTVFSL